MSDEHFLNRKGFLDKESILSLVSDEQVFSLVFGFEPKEYDRVCSPIRLDTVPSCYFECNINSGRIELIDWASEKPHMDSFECVMRYYQLPNFYQTLLFVEKHLIEGKNLPVRLNKEEKKEVKRHKTDLLFKSRNFIDIDRIFWSKFEISRLNLIEDKVYPVSKYQTINEALNKARLVNAYTPTYIFTKFKSGNRKLYFPYNDKATKSRFITNCNADDVGGIDDVDPFADYIIITKSYKDWRVIKNLGYNVIWLQNEGMIPSKDTWINDINIGKYKYVYIFFDSDEAGLRASKKLKEYLDTAYYCDARVNIFHLPLSYLKIGFKDPANIVEIKNSHYLKLFIDDNI